MSLPSRSRHLPPSLRIAIMTAGPIRQGGWGIAAFGIAFAGVFLAMTDLRIRSYDAVTSGVIQTVERTSSTQNDEYIYEVSVLVEEPAHRTVRSYTTDPPAVGDEVTVDYDSADPRDARLRGGFRHRFGPSSLFVLFIPAIALIFAGRRIGAARRAVRLLRYGHAARARVVAKRDGTDTVNGRPETVVTMEYDHPQGHPIRFEVHTFTPRVLEDDKRELVLFDPRDASRAIAIDSLPGRLTVTDTEVYVGLSVTHYAFLPALAVLATLGTVIAVLLTR